MSNADTQTAGAKTPTHLAYQIREGSEKNYWTCIGAAWAHKDGKGITLQLDSLSLDGKVTLRVASKKQ